LAAVLVCKFYRKEKVEVEVAKKKKRCLSLPLSLFPCFKRERSSLSACLSSLSSFDLSASGRASPDAGSCRDELEQEYRWRSDAATGVVGVVVVGGGNASSAKASSPSPRCARRHGHCSAFLLRSSSSAHVESRSHQAALRGERAWRERQRESSFDCHLLRFPRRRRRRLPSTFSSSSSLRANRRSRLPTPASPPSHNGNRYRTNKK